MAKIMHSEMRRGPEAPAPTSNVSNQQNFIVDDMSDVTTSVDQRLAAFEAPQPNQEPQRIVEAPIPKVDVASKKKLESLIFMGRHTKTVELAGHKFELSTLTHRENNEIVIKLMGIGETADIFIVRALTLANAVKSIDEMALDSFELDEQFETALDRRTAVIDQMQLALVERLYAAYEALVKEADEVIYGEKIKN